MSLFFTALFVVFIVVEIVSPYYERSLNSRKP